MLTVLLRVVSKYLLSLRWSVWSLKQLWKLSGLLWLSYACCSLLEAQQSGKVSRAIYLNKRSREKYINKLDLSVLVLVGVSRAIYLNQRSREKHKNKLDLSVLVLCWCSIHARAHPKRTYAQNAHTISEAGEGGM